MKLAVAITGASGAIYARRLLRVLQEIRAGTAPGIAAHPDLTVWWVASSNAPTVWQHELGEDMPTDLGEGFQRFDRGNFGAPFASGSTAPDAMICRK